MKCKDCRKGQYIKSTESIYCRIKQRFILVDKTDCKDYDERSIVTKKRMG